MLPRARGRCTRRAFDQGHYYLQVPKIGAIRMATNYPACHAFPLTPEWVTNSFGQPKRLHPPPPKRSTFVPRNTFGIILRMLTIMPNAKQIVPLQSGRKQQKPLCSPCKSKPSALNLSILCFCRSSRQHVPMQVFGSHWAIVCGQNNFCLFPGGRLQDSRGGLWLG